MPINLTSDDANSSFLPMLGPFPSLLDFFPTTPPASTTPYHQSPSYIDLDIPSSSQPTPSGSSSGMLGLDVASRFDIPAVISLGEEITDEIMANSSWQNASNHDDDADDSFFASSPSSCSSMSLSPDLLPASLPLWQEEHARLLHLRDSVLDSARESRDREVRLESEVARIKEDLARLKENHVRARWAQYTTAMSAQRLDVPVAGPSNAGPSRSYRSCVPDDEEMYGEDRPAAADTYRHLRSTYVQPSALACDIAAQPDAETLLANHLMQARSARAEERLKRRREHERVKELCVLLTLGSEVRQWEERLAWAQGRHVQSASRSMDMDVDPRKSKRLSRSVPATPPVSSSSHVPPTRSSPPSPALPSLSSSPLWRVSAEMILRRRSFSERPRRPATPPPASHHVPTMPISCSNTLRRSATYPQTSLIGGRRYPVPPPIAIPAYTTNVTVTVTNSCNTVASSEESRAMSIGARGPGAAVARPVKLDLTNTHAGSAASTSISIGLVTDGLSRSKSIPKRPSGLKEAFTLEDLVVPESPCAASAALSATSDKMDDADASDSDSSSGSESDDSRKSSSEEENRKGKDDDAVVRRGRARFSWRKSLTLNGGVVAAVQALQSSAMDIDS